MKHVWRSVRGLYYWPGQIGTHAVRLAKRRSADWYRITAPWILNRKHSDETKRRPKSPDWYRFDHKFTFNDEHVRFNLDYAVRAGDVKGLALIFFMGMGDYFFATPLIAEIKSRYPKLPIMGFASSNGGNVNSPMIADLLRADPNINEVRLYDGKQTRRYKNYDYRDALRQTPPGYLAIPVLYEHLPRTEHRLVSLYETFGFAAPITPPRPLLHLPPSPAPHVVKLLEKIKGQFAKNRLKGVVFLQTDSRSSHYAYPYADELAAGLSERGYYVVAASQLKNPPANAHALDFKEFGIMDSIHLLKLLREHFADTRVVSVASVFWSVSAGFDIPNLGMQHFADDAMHNFWYPNITVITHRDYPRLPGSQKIMAGAADYTLDDRGQAVFAPSFVLHCFDRMKNGSDQEGLAQPVRKAAV